MTIQESLPQQSMQRNRGKHGPRPHPALLASELRLHPRSPLSLSAPAFQAPASWLPAGSLSLPPPFLCSHHQGFTGAARGT